MDTLLISLGIISMIVFIWTTITIYSFLKKRYENIPGFIFINLFIFKYVKEYKTVTKNETGKTGILYYVWLVSINVALLCFILLMIFGDIS